MTLLSQEEIEEKFKGNLPRARLLVSRTVTSLQNPEDTLSITEPFTRALGPKDGCLGHPDQVHCVAV